MYNINSGIGCYFNMGWGDRLEIFIRKCILAKKNTSGKYMREIDINGKQTLGNCQKSCAPNKKITCPQGVRKMCNANDPHFINR